MSPEAVGGAGILRQAQDDDDRRNSTNDGSKRGGEQFRDKGDLRRPSYCGEIEFSVFTQTVQLKTYKEEITMSKRLLVSLLVVVLLVSFAVPVMAQEGKDEVITLRLLSGAVG